MAEQITRYQGRRPFAVELTAEDWAIFGRLFDSMDEQDMYQDSDEASARYMLSLLQQRRRFDLMPISMRIGG
jgi:hypothetical protein